jgi:hypothetical protein
MVTIPGEYKSFGHDYRADTLDFVAAAYDLPPVTPAQSAAIHNRLIERELDRANRIKGPTEEIVLTSEGAGSIQ